MRDQSTASRVGKVLAVAALVIVLTLIVLVYMGSQVSGRLGGPCSFPEQGPLPSYCPDPTAG